MLKRRSEKILFAGCAVSLVFFVFSRNWVFVWLTGAAFLFEMAISVALMVVKKGPRGIWRLIIFCSQCNELLPLLPENRAPEYSPPPDYIEMPKDDSLDFLRRHFGHTLNYLEIIFGPWRKGLPEDPMAPNYFVARHDAKLFFIKGHRESIGKPMLYKIAKKYEIGKKEPCDFWTRWRFVSLIFQ